MLLGVPCSSSIGNGLDKAMWWPCCAVLRGLRWCKVLGFGARASVADHCRDPNFTVCVPEQHARHNT